MQRRKAGNSYVVRAENSPEVIEVAPRAVPAGAALLIPRDVGGPKTRRTAEEYTNYVASRSTDFILSSQGSRAPGENGLNTGAVKKTLNRICNGPSGCAPTILPVKIPGSLVGTTGQRLRLN